jgi:hypothetical protein
VSEKSAFVDEDGVPESDDSRLDECAHSQDVLLHVEPTHDRRLLLKYIASAMVGFVLEFRRKLDATFAQNRKVSAQPASTAWAFDDRIIVEHAKRQVLTFNLSSQRQLHRPDDVSLDEEYVLPIVLLEPGQSDLADFAGGTWWPSFVQTAYLRSVEDRRSSHETDYASGQE